MTEIQKPGITVTLTASGFSRSSSGASVAYIDYGGIELDVPSRGNEIVTETLNLDGADFEPSKVVLHFYFEATREASDYRVRTTSHNSFSTFGKDIVEIDSRFVARSGRSSTIVFFDVSISQTDYTFLNDGVNVTLELDYSNLNYGDATVRLEGAFFFS